MTRDLLRSRQIAYVDVRLPEAATPHPTLFEFVRNRLAGRNPLVFEEDGQLSAIFCVEDRTRSTMARVGLFSEELTTLLRAEASSVSFTTLSGEPGTPMLSDVGVSVRGISTLRGENTLNPN